LKRVCQDYFFPLYNLLFPSFYYKFIVFSSIFSLWFQIIEWF
jgi:hypothetical protein